MSMRTVARRSCIKPLLEIVEQRILLSTFTVNTSLDSNDLGSGFLTLRQAIADANSNPGDNTIQFSPTAFPAGTLTSIDLTAGPLDLTSTSGDTTIDGTGQSVLDINGNQSTRVFQISAGTVYINDLTITNGAVNTAAGVIATGGGVQNAGSLTLTDVTLSHNSATGGSFSTTVGDGGAAYGGGIYSTGSLTLVDSVVSGNSAQGGDNYSPTIGNPSPCSNIADGGGIYCTGPLTMTDCTVSGNSASGGGDSDNDVIGVGGNASGGGVYVTGAFVIDSSSFSSNLATGGGFSNQDFSLWGIGGTARGGGLFTGAGSSMTNVTVSDNQATGGNSGPNRGYAGQAWGGGIFSDAVLSIASSTISGNLAEGNKGPTNDNGPGSNAYGGGIAAEAALTITGTIVSSNTAEAGSGGALTDDQEASGYGGGIWSTQSLTAATSTISGNTAEAVMGDRYYGGTGGDGEGGGICVFGTTSVSACTVNDNDATGGPGDSANATGTGGTGGTGEGGGIFNGGSLATVNSTLTANQANGGAGGGFDGGDGGDAIGGAICTSSSLEMDDSTVTGNAVSGGKGGLGGEFAPNGSAGSMTGAGVAILSGTAIFSNSIIAADTGDDDIFGTAGTSSGYNLIGTGGGLTNGVNGNQVDVTNPQLGALADNGGPTETMLPRSGSPAIGNGSVALIPSGVTTDQRGDPRTSNGTVDIGAVEVQRTQAAPPEVTLTAPISQSAKVNQSSSFNLGSFAESNATGPFAVTINWGDGSADGSLVANNAGTIPAQLHTYSSVGSNLVTVTVSDADGNASSTAQFTVSVASLLTPVGTLTTSANIVAVGTPVVLTAALSGDAGTPTGTVSFSANSGNLGSSNLSNGTAIYAGFTPTAAGTFTLSATYGGDSNYLSAVLQPVTVTVYTPSSVNTAFSARTSLPAALIAGDKLELKTVVTLSGGNTPLSGKFAINYYLSPTTSLSGSQSPVGSVLKRITLKAGKAIQIGSVINSKATKLTAGNYYLVAQLIDPTGAQSYTSTLKTISIVEPLIRLLATAGAVNPETLSGRRSGFIDVTITNEGNVAASGLLSITVDPLLNGSLLPSLLGAYQAKAVLPPGKHKTARVRLKAPAGLAAGSYLESVSISLAGETATAVGSSTITIV